MSAAWSATCARLERRTDSAFLRSASELCAAGEGVAVCGRIGMCGGAVAACCVVLPQPASLHRKCIERAEDR
eukprot:2515609-Prymnesium_polylepis.3